MKFIGNEEAPTYRIRWEKLRGAFVCPASSDESTMKSVVSPMPYDHDRPFYLKKRREKNPQTVVI